MMIAPLAIPPLLAVLQLLYVLGNRDAVGTYRYVFAVNDFRIEQLQFFPEANLYQVMRFLANVYSCPLPIQFFSGYASSGATAKWIKNNIAFA